MGGFRVLNGRLRLSRIGLIKAKLSRSIQGVQKTCTIIKDIDRWYACIATLSKTPQNVCQKPGRPAVGVDLGISRLATLSDGMTFENPKTAGSSVKRIKTLQRRLSRRNKGSRNWNKTRTLLGKAWRKVRNQRLDSNHKISTYLASEYSTIVFEDLPILNMVKNRYLAAAIMEASWGHLRRLTAYKAEKRGGRVLLVNPS